MPTKRRNNGRSKNNKGKSIIVRCINCRRCVPKDKAIKRYQMRNMVDGSSKADIRDSSAYPTEQFYMPKIYVKLAYCVSCAIHAKVVRVRSAQFRKTRTTTKLRAPERRAKDKQRQEQFGAQRQQQQQAN